MTTVFKFGLWFSEDIGIEHDPQADDKILAAIEVILKKIGNGTV